MTPNPDTALAQRRWVRCAVVVMFVALAAVRALGSEFPFTLESGAYDLAVRKVIPRAPVSGEIVVVAKRKVSTAGGRIRQIIVGVFS